MTPRVHASLAMVALALGAAHALPAPARAATIGTFTIADPPGQGFLDPTPAAPIGGNPGTTVGEQRQRAVRHALEQILGRLDSPVPVTVHATFDPDMLPCSSNAGALAGAGPGHMLADFVRGSPRVLPATLYPAALADRLAGEDLVPLPAPSDAGFRSAHDLVLVYNARLGQPDCLAGAFWYHGLDDAVPRDGVSLVATTLHEAAHALGFLTAVDLATGEFPRIGLGDGTSARMPDVFSHLVYDGSLAKRWPQMTAAERQSSITNTGRLLWDGARVTAMPAAQPGCTGDGGRMRLFAPATVATGSSVAHWDQACGANLLLKPRYSALGTLEVTLSAFEDIGWGLRGGCGDGFVDPAEQCDLGTRNGQPGSCCSTGCTLVAAGTTCRPAAGPCDVPESCTGNSALCPADVLAPASQVCRAAAGPCDAAETCSGSAAACPPDGNLADGVACGPATACARSVCQRGACAVAHDHARCDDGNPCTADACGPDGCTSAPVPDGTRCTGGACRQGRCEPPPAPPDAGVAPADAAPAADAAPDGAPADRAEPLPAPTPDAPAAPDRAPAPGLDAAAEGAAPVAAAGADAAGRDDPPALPAGRKGGGCGCAVGARGGGTPPFGLPGALLGIGLARPFWRRRRAADPPRGTPAPGR